MQTPRTKNDRTPMTTPSAAGSSIVPFTPSTSKKLKIHSMRTQKAVSTKKEQSKKVFKPAMATPYQIPWNPLSLDESHTILTQLTNGIHHRRTNATTPPASSSSSSTTSSSTTNTHTGKRKRESEETDEPQESSNSILSGIVVGVNAVTRAATNGELSLVVVCRSVQPIVLVAHLPVICQLNQIPLIALNQQINTRMLAHTLEPPSESDKEKSRRLQLCTCLGVRRGHLASTVAAIQSLAQVPKLHWLLPTARPTYEPVNVLNTEHDKKLKGTPRQKNNQQQGKANTGDAASTAPNSSPSPIHAGGGRIESATQRKKKQKLSHAEVPKME